VEIKADDTLTKLTSAGFGSDELFTKMSDIYETAEDDSIKRQILDMAIKMHGLYANKDDNKVVPKFNLNIISEQGNRIYEMLCPPMEVV
jgi:hypothetical protein